MSDHVNRTEQKIETAAQDSDLVAFYELRMKGDSDRVDENRLYDIARYPENQLRGEISRDHDLPEGAWRRVVARCVAKIAGVEVGAANNE